MANTKVQASGMVVHSAGLAAVQGNRVDGKVSSILAGLGLDVSAHRSRLLDIDMIRAAQLVLVMELDQIKGVEAVDQSSKGKVHLLGKWESVEVLDPYRQEESIYRASAELVERSVANWIKKIC